jgi:hypothetical protein
MRATRRILLLACALAACLVAFLVPAARAAPPAAGRQVGHAVQAARKPARKTKGAAPCTVQAPVIGGSLSELTNGICGVVEGAAGAVGGVAGEAVGAAGSAILDGVAHWMIGAATQVTSFVAKEMQRSTTPQLRSAWFQAQFAPMADLGAALALLVTLVAFASAAVRRDPQALAATLAGIVRAGLGTTVVVALTALGLEVADQISAAVLSSSPHAFWATVAQAWGTKDFGGFASSALATLIAAVETFGALFVWLELIVRNAAIYLAVLFFPVVLAASIWPALHAWTGRLARLLLLFVVLKPVALIVLSLAGNAAAAGLSGASGISGSVGTILAAVVIFALAAFTPWALMFLLAADAESAYTAAGVRAATAGAVAGSGGRSLRNAGGLRTPGARRAGGRGSPGGSSSGGGSPGGSAGGGGSPGTDGGPTPSGGGSPGGASGGGSLPRLSLVGGSTVPPNAGAGSQDSADSGSSSAAGGSAAANGAVPAAEETGAADGRTSPIAAEAVGGGSIGAAAGVSPVAVRARSSTTRQRGAGSDSAQPQSAGAAPRPPAPVAPAGASTSTNARPTPPATVGGASQGSPSPAPGDGSAGAPAQERQPPPPARPPQRHLHVVRDEAKDEHPPDPDLSGPEAA